MEVLASMFVICIGLLGVLAVIPYGAYQTAKARNAENTAWLLDAAKKELQAMELAKPENWIVQHYSNPLETLDGTKNLFLNHPVPDNKQLNCSRFLMVDPFADISIQSSMHIYRIGTNFTNPELRPQLLRDRMTGQDDLIYTIHPDKRTDFEGQNNKILSSGQYTWFFMFQPQVNGGTPANIEAVYWTTTNEPGINVDDEVDIDILACYNRVPGDQKEQSVFINSYVSYYNSISVTIPSGDYDLKNTKYVFFSWDNGLTPYTADGCWYKIIYATEPYLNAGNLFIDIFLKLPDAIATPPTIGTSRLQITIIPGVMYHTQIQNVTIK
jgi:hypothetical protein